MEIGSYRILSKIGEGSFGRTFLAEHKILGHKVLLKQEKTADPVFMKTFEQEARKLQKVLHFGFPTLLDYFDTPDYGQVMAITYAEGIPGDKLKPVADEHMCWILERVLIDVMSGEPPKDMHPDLKNLIRSMIVRDPRNRPTDCASLKAQIVSLRQKIWGRTTTREEIQYR